MAATATATTCWNAVSMGMRKSQIEKSSSLLQAAYMKVVRRGAHIKESQNSRDMLRAPNAAVGDRGSGNIFNSMAGS